MMVLKYSMCSPCSLAVFDRDTSVSWAEAGDFCTDGRNHTDAFVARRGWKLRCERVFAFDGVDI
jgi:hypothetical protein